MLLDRIDIDSHGPLAQIGLGPFSQQLNVISAAAGSGKTALVRFLRDSLTGTTPAYDGMAQSSGRVVWAAADGLYHCRREPNGTTQGRRFVEFESRLGGQHNGWNRPSLVVDLPASIVDGIVTDTTLTSVRRVAQSVLRSGLDHVSNGTTSHHGDEITALRAEIGRLRAQLNRARDTAGDTSSENQIRDRLAALTLELGAIDSRREFARQTEAALERVRRDRESMMRAVDEVERLRTQETELRKRLRTLDQTLLRLEEQMRRDEDRVATTQLTRSRVSWLNQQIDRFRRLLGDVRDLGDLWFGGHRTVSGTQRPPATAGPLATANLLSEPAVVDKPAVPLTRSELELVDRGWLSHRQDNASTRYSGLAAGTEVGSRLDALCRLVDHLVGRLEAEQEHWIRVDHPAGEIFDDVLTESERALQRMHRTAASEDHERADSLSYQPLLADPGWIDDSLRRRRIDSLRRAEQRRRLDESTDREIVQGRPEDAFLITLRAIGSTLHSVSRRLRGLRAQCQQGAAEPSPWNSAGWIDAEPLHDLGSSALPPVERVDALRRCERELVATLERLAQHRVGLLRRVAQAERLPESLLEAVLADASILPSAVDAWLATNLSPATPDLSGGGDSLVEASGSESREATRARLEQQRRELAVELKQTIARMNQQLADAERLRTRLKTVPVQAQGDDDQSQRDRIEAEIHRLHRLLTAPAEPALLQRYRQCVLRLRELEGEQQAVSPLAAIANSYLQRLSGGRLQRVAWQSHIDSSTPRRHVEVTIDSRPERHCDPADRYLVTLAIRMAAADELSRRGRPLPLVIETPARTESSLGLFTLGSDTPRLFRDEIHHQTQNPHDPRLGTQHLVETLAEVADRGRQIILLTDDRSLTDAVVHVGGRSYALHRAQSTRLPIQDVNRSFDIQWRESQGIDDLELEPAASSPADGEGDLARRAAFDLPAAGAAERRTASDRPQSHRTAAATAGDPQDKEFPAVASEHFSRSSGVRVDFSDPQDHGRDVVAFPTRERVRNGRGGAESSPFFLTGDSAIEQSPSIDVLAASRLRGLGVVIVSQLLSSSPGELADRMQMADINAATIRRWQNECRLVCGVPGLRGFDARVLVGCGMVHPREIAETQPAELVEKVEAFLATPRGVQILRTGTSHEVSRLTRWIAEARQATRGSDAVMRGGSSGAGRGQSTDARSEGAAQAQQELGSQVRGGRKGASRSRVRRADRSNPASGREASGSTAEVSATASAAVATLDRDASDQELEFLLHRSSPIADAPAIGSRMAERLAGLKILTVDDLLAAKPAAVAAELKLRRVDESVVRSWQQQIQLVCRVPMLRGPEAQLLVAAGITQPERLAQCDPQWLLSQIDPISHSREGQSILRGSQAPELAEIAEWIHHAKCHRELRAA